MKYKVIGWTYYDNNEIITSQKNIGFAERNAIIDEIRKHKYLFSGWHHQEHWDGVVPILNDGKKRCFSQRGWGGVMAEAYGHMGDYDYSNYTFYQSIDSKNMKCADDIYDLSDYEAEIIETEHFEVSVNEGLFEIAKTKNPFYLPDLDLLRSIDEDDTITLTCNGESLTFVVKDIDRNKKEIKFPSYNLIEGKYKVIVTHKPESERRKAKLPTIYTISEVRDLFKSCYKNYNYDVLLELISNFEIGYLCKDSISKSTMKLLTRFANEYSDDNFNSKTLLEVLKYIDDIQLFEQIAYKTIKKDDCILVSFVNHFKDKGVNMDKYLPDVFKLVKHMDYSMNKLLLRAIELKPNNKSLRKKYYRNTNATRLESFAVLAGLDMYDSLRKEHKGLIDLNNYSKYSDRNVLKVLEYLTYPKFDVIYSKNYPYNVPNIYTSESKVIEDGIYKYQQYIKENFDLDSFLLDMMLYGIDKNCYQMDRYMDGERHSANYVYTLDALTDFKYNLKEKALAKYASIYKNFEAEIEERYK